ncbi:hypothetical protein TCCBUS3UF1_7260 [Thermus sp. CCB_US3_UF1]|uniref:hypothetical protein n=1 Tax=unclassified Thermus TaxID=2619321 RepID=UPI000238959F|nr:MULTISPECIES: hypothetical protein [unclassified Thermus]AEV15774.1 hypothetical protein TCCBUS3UF1_7260 [Thermus sp. CCB_US3_UF1]MCX7849751.1 hypothetical protein [Thermus sp.]
MMKHALKNLALLGFLALGTLALAQTTDTQSISIQVSNLEEITVVSGQNLTDSLTDPNTIRAGNYNKDFDTTLRFSTNANALRKITAQASFSAPSGATLLAKILANGFSTQAGNPISQDVTLGQNPVDLITGIKNVASKEASFKVRVSIPDAPILAGTYQVSITYTLMGY